MNRFQDFRENEALLRLSRLKTENNNKKKYMKYKNKIIIIIIEECKMMVCIKKEIEENGIFLEAVDEND